MYRVVQKVAHFSSTSVYIQIAVNSVAHQKCATFWTTVYMLHTDRELCSVSSPLVVPRLDRPVVDTCPVRWTPTCFAWLVWYGVDSRHRTAEDRPFPRTTTTWKHSSQVPPSKRPRNCADCQPPVNNCSWWKSAAVLSGTVLGNVERHDEQGLVVPDVRCPPTGLALIHQRHRLHSLRGRILPGTLRAVKSWTVS